jgi:ketosteroid isomerase-like protein
VSDRVLIESAIAKFVEAYNSANLDTVFDYYADDLIKLRNGTPAETKAETERRVREVFAHYECRVDVINEEVQVAGNMAFTRGSFRLSITPRTAAGETQVFDRRYLEIWRKENGRWLVARTMDNI